MTLRVDALLAPVDFSDVTGAVLDTAESLAGAFGARLYLLHVTAPEPDFVGYEPGPQVVRDAVADALREEHRQLGDLADALEQRGVRVLPAVVRGPTIQAILDQAEKLQADLIVLGSHGHGALHKALMGSTSEGVLRQAPCPVVIVPAEREE